MTHDVAIIGCGRVGLPLALAFADRGLRVLGIDNDQARLAAVRDGRMPFDEPSAPEIPKVPTVAADHVEKWVLATPADGANVSAVALVLDRAAAAFQVVACRVDAASFAPVVSGSAVLSWVNARTLTVPPLPESRAWLA